jgi:hypothetical protein
VHTRELQEGQACQVRGACGWRIWIVVNLTFRVTARLPTLSRVLAIGFDHSRSPGPHPSIGTYYSTRPLHPSSPSVTRFAVVAGKPPVVGRPRNLSAAWAPPTSKRNCISAHLHWPVVVLHNSPVSPPTADPMRSRKAPSRRRLANSHCS